MVVVFGSSDKLDGRFKGLVERLKSVAQALS